MMKKISLLVIMAMTLAPGAFEPPASAQTTQTVKVPEDKYAAFIVPDPGASLTLTISAGDNELVESHVVPEDTGDKNLWSPLSRSGSAPHVYGSSVILSSCEWLRIHGQFKKKGVGVGHAATVVLSEFDVDVPGVDIDISDVTEEKEEAEGGFVCVGTTGLRKVTIRQVESKSRFSGTVKLTATGVGTKIRIWDSQARTNEITTFPKNYTTPSGLPRDIWVEGIAASAAPRDVELKVSYTTPTGNKTSEDKVKLTVLKVNMDSFTYFRPTSADPAHPSVVYTPLVRGTDKLYFKFKLKILPSSGLSGVKYQKVKVSLLDGTTSLASEEHTFSTSYYPDITMIAGSYIDPLTIPGSVTDIKTYTFRIDAFLDANGTVLESQGVDTKNVETHFNAVEVGRKISGEDNGSDAAREQVKLTILNRWNFPTIANGRSFTQSVLRHGQATIYDLAQDGIIFQGTADLDDTVQHARELAKALLANPTSANGNGPIYFHLATDTSSSIYILCRDASAPQVNLLNNTATYGNKYFSPSSDPNTWTTQTVKDGYDADPTDSLSW